MGNPIASQRMPRSEETVSSARPKLLRRPAQFSEVAEKFPVLAEPSLQLPAIAPSVETPPVSSARLWQDDGRFGAVMLAVVLITNLMLMAWLPHLDHTKSPATPSTITQGSTMPTPRTMPNSQITIYSHPETAATHAPVLSPAVDVRPVSGFEVPTIPPPVHLLDETATDSDQ